MYIQLRVDIHTIEMLAYIHHISLKKLRHNSTLTALRYPTALRGAHAANHLMDSHLLEEDDGQDLHERKRTTTAKCIQCHTHANHAVTHIETKRGCLYKDKENYRFRTTQAHELVDRRKQ